MGGVLTGFAIIAAIIAVGYLVGRARILGDGAPYVLSRLVFFVLSPCLLFTVLAGADIHVLFSLSLGVGAVSSLVSIAIFALIAVFVFRRRLGETVIGSLAAGYVNANNIGIPVAVYVFGDPALSAPVLLFQLLVLAPVALTLLDIATTGSTSFTRILLGPIRNPLIIASVLGVLVSLTGLELPDPVIEPLRIIGAAAVPVVLVGFGISLHGRRPLAAGSGRRDVVVASFVKLAMMPLVAWGVASLLGLDGELLRAAVVLAALPSAQNVFNYAQRYGIGETVARDTVLITTFGSLPVLLAIALITS